MSKPVVFLKNVSRVPYSDGIHLLGTIVSGHPFHDDGTEVCTTAIQKENEDGSVETKNTVYHIQEN